MNPQSEIARIDRRQAETRTFCAEAHKPEFLLETLKAIQTKIAKMADDITDLKADMRGMKGHMAAFMQSEVAQDGSIASIQARLDRIERRLELTE